MPKKRAEKIETVNIIGRKWFDKANGNTYFSAKVYINGREHNVTDFSYGYDNHYIDHTAKWMQDNGFIKLEHRMQPFWQWAADNDVHFTANACYVERKKDL